MTPKVYRSPFPWLKQLDAHRDVQRHHSMGDTWDEKWRYVDKQGHGHFYTTGEALFPTLKWVVDEEASRYEEEDGYWEEYPEVGHWECAACGEVIKPGRRKADDVVIQGPVEYTATIVMRTEGRHSEMVFMFDDRVMQTVSDALRERMVELLDDGGFLYSWRDL